MGDYPSGQQLFALSDGDLACFRKLTYYSAIIAYIVISSILKVGSRCLILATLTPHWMKEELKQRTLTKQSGFPTSHPPRFYAAPKFLKMGIKMPRDVVFWTTSTMKDEKSAAKFHYIKTVSGKVLAHSIAFRVVSIYL